MLGVSAATRTLLYRGSTDMGCPSDGLAGLVHQGRGGDQLSGAWSVVVNRCRPLVGLLYWTGDGSVIRAQRLGKGTFSVPPVGDGCATLDCRQEMVPSGCC